MISYCMKTKLLAYIKNILFIGIWFPVIHNMSSGCQFKHVKRMHVYFLLIDEVYYNPMGILIPKHIMTTAPYC